MLKETKNDIIRITLLSLLAVALGVIFLLVPEDILLWLGFVALGLAIIIFSLPEFIHGIQYMREEPIGGFILTCIVLGLGFALIFWQQPVLMIAIGIALIIIPIAKIVICNAKMAMFRAQLPILILGIILLIVGPGAFVNFLFNVAGWAIIGLGVVYFIYSLIFTLTKRKSHAIQQEKTEIGNE